MRPFHHQLMVNCELHKDNPCLLNYCSNTDRVNLSAINVVVKECFVDNLVVLQRETCLDESSIGMPQEKKSWIQNSR